MADRNPSFFGGVLPDADHSIEAFSAEELARIQARRIDRDIHRAYASPWPKSRRFATLYPMTPPEPRTSETPRMRRIERTPYGVRIVDA